jgi:cellulose synthase/poly-beta-1,6-N-acetylglucosamine synthase-like glycosyltransferase
LKEKIWQIFFYVILAIWSTIIGSALYYMITGDEILIDTSINLNLLTLPFLIIILFYTFLTVVLFVIYLITDRKVKLMQNIAYSKFLKNSQGNNELCTVIIASRNEDSVIRKTVEECLKQTYLNIEIVVVCHNCTDKTFEEASVNDGRIRVFDYKTKEAGKGIALNFGVQKSHGEYILILDADGILSKDFIEKALPLLKDYAAVQGRYIPSNRNYSLVTQLLSLEGDLWSTPIMTARTFLDKRCGLGGTGYIIRKDILLNVGGFTNHLVDDYELTCRMLKKKFRIVFAPFCINYDEKPPNIEIMLRQRARWAKGFIDLLKQRIFEPTDILGFIFWLSPIVIFITMAMFFIVGFAIVFNIIFGYFPYYYTSITINQWLALTGILGIIQCLVLTKQYGKNGIKYAIYLPIFIPFILYVFVTFIRALGIKSWGNTKTTHGFTKNPKKQK